MFLHPELGEVSIHPSLPAPAGTLREDDPTLRTLYQLAEAEIRAHPAYWQWRYRRWGRD
jgi:lauroyl/myristoyl acyltransferase